MSLETAAPCHPTVPKLASLAIKVLGENYDRYPQLYEDENEVNQQPAANRRLKRNQEHNDDSATFFIGWESFPPNDKKRFLYAALCNPAANGTYKSFKGGMVKLSYILDF